MALKNVVKSEFDVAAAALLDILDERIE